MSDPAPADAGHATAPRGLVVVAVAGMVLISLGTVYASLFVFLVGLLLLCGAFAPLLMMPEPERAPAPDPAERAARAPAPASLPWSAHP